MANIISIFTDTVGQIGQNPRIVKIISKDNLATVTAAGYLNPSMLEGYTIFSTDEIHMWYGWTAYNNPGTFSVFTPSISNGVITLTSLVNVANVLLPVVNGNIAMFNGTTGQISDSGILASSLQVSSLTVTLNQAAVQSAFATPFQLIAAPGAGKVIILDNVNIYTNFQTSAFTGGGIAIVQYNNTIHGAGTNALSATIPTAEITASASQIYHLGSNSGNALTGITNEGIFFSNATGAFTGGNAASTVVIMLNYVVMTATV
jgi:hypothetical protein